jgi:hypothetical protein
MGQGKPNPIQPNIPYLIIGMHHGGHCTEITQHTKKRGSGAASVLQGSVSGGVSSRRFETYRIGFPWEALHFFLNIKKWLIR